MKILVAIDGSDCSQRALLYVLEHTALFGYAPDLTLINVHRPIPSARAKAWVGQDVVDHYYKEEAEIALAPARALLAKHQRNAGELLKIGEPGQEVAAAANDGFDLIVMGTKGRTGLANLLMGSAATSALAESKVPVLLVK
jgi:nucleotide-binding universal stress UspA family protein